MITVFAWYSFGATLPPLVEVLIRSDVCERCRPSLGSELAPAWCIANTVKMPVGLGGAEAIADANASTSSNVHALFQI